MRRVFVFLALSLLVASAAYPCSGKYVGRNAVLNAAPAMRPASILILNNQSLKIYAKSLKSTLKQLGHRVKEVRNPEEIVKALNSGKKFDIVMANVADMGALVEQIGANAADVVPVSLIPGDAGEDVVLPAGYPTALNLSAKSTMIRQKLEKAMEEKEEKARENKEKA